MPELIIQSDDEEWTYELEQAVTFVGRDGANELQIDDPSVSGRHCRIEKTDYGYVITDLGGRNGTRVNGKKIKEHLLEPQDKIELGRAAIYFDSVPPPLEGCVQVLNGEQKGNTFDLKGEISTLGRNESCAVIVHDDSVSNFHAAIERSGRGFLIRDLHSRNGTFVGGDKLGERPVDLADGVQFLLGNSKLMFRELVPIEGIEPPPEPGAPDRAQVPSRKTSAAAGRRAGAVAHVSPEDLAAIEEEARHELIFRRRRRSPILSILGGLAAVALVAGMGYALLKLRAGGGVSDESAKGDGDLLKGCGSFKEEAGSHWKFEGRNQKQWEVEEGSLVALPLKGPGVMEAICDKVIDVSQSKIYGVKCNLKSEGELGLSGLKIVWRSQSDPAYIFESYSNLTAGKADWHEVKAVFHPPPGATELQAGCVAIGNPGKVFFDSVVLWKQPRPGYVGEMGAGVGMGVTLGDRGMVTVSKHGDMIVWDLESRLETAPGAVILQKYCESQPKYLEGFSSTLVDPMTLTPIDFHVMIQADSRGGGAMIRYTFKARQKIAMKSIGVSFLIRKSDLAEGVLVGQDLGGFVKDGEFEASSVNELVLAHGQRRVVMQPANPIGLARRDIGEAAQFLFWLPIEVLDAGEEIPFELYLKTSSRLADDEAQKLKIRAASAATANEIGDAVRLYSEIEKNPFFSQEDRDDAKKEADALREKAKTLIAEAEGVVDKYVADPTKENEQMARGKLQELKLALAEEKAAGDVMVYVEFKPAVKGLENKLEQQKQDLVAKAESDVKKLMANAEKALDNEQWMIARVFLENVIKRVPDSEEAKKARQLLDNSKKQEERANERNDWIDRKMNEAKNYHKNKMADRAIQILESIIQKYPDAPGTKQATTLLEKIKKEAGK